MATEATTQATTAGDAGSTSTNKPTYTPEQQEHINNLIRDAMGRAGAEAKAEAARVAGELTSLRTELDQAKAALQSAKTPAAKADAKGDIAALEAQIAEMKTASLTTQQELERLRDAHKAKEAEIAAAKAEAVNVRKQVAITNAASKVNFVNTEVVAKLTQDNVKYDEQKGRFVVLNDQGQERLNASFEPMSLDEFYTEFAAKNPYLVRGDVKSGTGSTESKRFDVSGNGKFEVKQIFGKESSSVLASKLMKEDPKEYKRLKEIAKSSGLIA